MTTVSTSYRMPNRKSVS